MAVINTNAADGYIDRLPPDIRFCLVHGGDEGLIEERARAILRKLLGTDPDPLRLVRLEGDALARQPGALSDEAYAVSMFGGSRAIVIDAQGRDLMRALEPLFGQPPTKCAIIVKAGQLKRGHALRVAFEKRRAAASIECYSDNATSLGALIDREMREAGLTIDADARAELLASLGADRMASRGEIAKLALFARDKGRVALEDVQAIVADAAPSPLERLVDEALLGNLRATAEDAERFLGGGGDAEQLLARLGSRMTALHRLRLEMEAGRDFDVASQAQPVWGSPESRRALATAAQRWTAEAIAESLPALRAASANARLNPDLAKISATRALWALASKRRNAQR